MHVALESSPDCIESAFPTVSQCQVPDNDGISELTHPETFLYEVETTTSLLIHLVRHFICLISN
jgi:hypothetical protein